MQLYALVFLCHAISSEKLFLVFQYVLAEIANMTHRMDDTICDGKVSVELVEINVTVKNQFVDKAKFS